ncbi:MAG: hypothetical protein KF883_08340 [Thermomicrobiales bacterium]|nr:hypothetical protein [Thermomicrobiales bacterium]
MSDQNVDELMGAIVDTLLPGDGDFPAASTTGIQPVVIQRLRQRLGPEAPDELVRALGAGFSSLPVPERVEAMAAFAASSPLLFAELRFATYFAYYETPAVIQVLQRLGHQYNLSPLPHGYTMDPFDPAIGTPSDPRGSYKATESIDRLDISSLADLGLRVVADGQV